VRRFAWSPHPFKFVRRRRRVRPRKTDRTYESHLAPNFFFSNFWQLHFNEWRDAMQSTKCEASSRPTTNQRSSRRIFWSKPQATSNSIHCRTLTVTFTLHGPIIWIHDSWDTLYHPNLLLFIQNDIQDTHYDCNYAFISLTSLIHFEGGISIWWEYLRLLCWNIQWQKHLMWDALGVAWFSGHCCLSGRIVNGSLGGTPPITMSW
jgi:hypothetical protein